MDLDCTKKPNSKGSLAAYRSQAITVIASSCLSGCFSKPQGVVLWGDAPDVSKNFARISVAVRHRRGLSKILGRPLRPYTPTASKALPGCRKPDSSMCLAPNPCE